MKSFLLCFVTLMLLSGCGYTFDTHDIEVATWICSQNNGVKEIDATRAFSADSQTVRIVCDNSLSITLKKARILYATTHQEQPTSEK